MKAIRHLALFFLYIAMGGFFSLFFLAVMDSLEPKETSFYLLSLLPFALLSWGILEFLDFVSRRNRLQ